MARWRGVAEVGDAAVGGVPRGMFVGADGGENRSSLQREAVEVLVRHVAKVDLTQGQGGLLEALPRLGVRGRGEDIKREVTLW